MMSFLMGLGLGCVAMFYFKDKIMAIVAMVQAAFLKPPVPPADE